MFIIDCLSSSESLFVGSGLAAVILESADLFRHLENVLVDIPTSLQALNTLAPLDIASSISFIISLRSSAWINLPLFPRKSHLTFF